MGWRGHVGAQGLRSRARCSGPLGSSPCTTATRGRRAQLPRQIARMRSAAPCGLAAPKLLTMRTPWRRHCASTGRSRSSSSGRSRLRVCRGGRVGPAPACARPGSRRSAPRAAAVHQGLHHGRGGVGAVAGKPAAQPTSRGGDSPWPVLRVVSGVHVGGRLFCEIDCQDQFIGNSK